MDPCRLIIDPPQSGTWNMAVDEALLARSAHNGIATLRLYAWSEPTLSLGYFQRLAERETHAASRAAEVVRRQSGGGAILHDRELTYSLTLPATHPLARDTQALYRSVHNAFVDLLSPRLAASQNAWSLALNGKPMDNRADQEPFLCFERRAVGDLLLVDKEATLQTNVPPLAYKILGSAQRRHRGAVLQHGSFLLAGSPAAPELPGWNDLTNVELPSDALAAALVRQLFTVLGSIAEPLPIPADVCDSARKIEQAKYSSRSWTARR